MSDIFPNASKDFIAINPGLSSGPSAKPLSVTSPVSTFDTGDFQGPESELQKQCEKVLEHMGYARRSQKAVLQEPWPAKGWFFHMVRAKANPLVLDLIILANDGRFLEVELKTARGSVRPWQKVMVSEFKPAVLVRAVRAFREKVKQWECNEEEP